MTMISVPVTEASQVGEARRRAGVVSKQLGFGETAAGRVAIAVTELATNLVKYGAAGEILLGTFEDDTGTGVELIALDKEPGFANVAEALRDGHSTGGSPGTGLGAVQRQSQAFDIVSTPGRGTAVLARIQAAPRSPQAPFELPSRFGAVVLPLQGETACGDAYAICSRASGWTVIVADGLGHGPNAAQASEEAIRLFRKNENKAPDEIIAAVHAGLRHTRGGAVSVARYDANRAVLVFAGIGNVAGAIVNGGETKRMVSLAGTAGHMVRRIQAFEYPFPLDSLLVMCSDGIGTSWSFDRYPGLVGAHPSLIAAVIYRDFARGRDDAAVVVARGELS